MPNVVGRLKSVDRISSGQRFIMVMVSSILAVANCSAQNSSILEDAYRQAEQIPLLRGGVAMGSGVFISPKNVLTSAHVLAGCQSYLVENPSIGALQAEIGYVNRHVDVAVLNLRHSASSDFIRLASGNGKRTRVRLMGYSAYMSGSDYPTSFDAATLYSSDPSVIALSADVPSGMSGGPIIDKDGLIIGVITGRMNEARREIIASPIAAVFGDIAKFTSGKAVGTLRSAVVKVICSK